MRGLTETIDAMRGAMCTRAFDATCVGMLAAAALWAVVPAPAAIGGAVLAALFVLWLTAPLVQLRTCIERLVNGRMLTDEEWPQAGSEAGRLCTAVKTLVERDERRRADTLQAMQRLQAVLDHAPVGIAFGRNSNFELVSRHLAQMFGRDAAQMSGQSTRIMYASDADRADLVERAKSMFSATGSFDGEARLAHADGRVFWGRLRGRAVRPGHVGAGTIWIIEDITHAREEHEKLAWAAEHDALTGLVNRGGFEMRLKRAHDERCGFCALFIDLDRFKRVNDTAGHAAGDRLLTDLAKLIGEPVRDSDTVARLGGDEFALLLPSCPPARAMVIAEQIRARVESYRLHWEGVAHGVGASIGMVHDDGSFETSDAVVAAADAACYAAKRSGRNRVVQWRRESGLANAA